MDKEKEIEEMARTFCRNSNNGVKCNECISDDCCSCKIYASRLVDAGYGNVKRAVKGFAEELKRRLKLGIYGAYIWKYAEVDCEIIDNLVKKFNGEDKESE